MIICWKDGLKLAGISVVCMCAVTVCTFMLGFYIDALSIAGEVTEVTRPLYEAQLAVARFVSALSGGFLALIAAVMLAFYIRLYISNHSIVLGILKAMGYADGSLALRFWVFGLAVLVGCAAGFILGLALAPVVYGAMRIEGMTPAPVRFHFVLLVCLVLLSSVLFSAISCLCALFVLRRPVAGMLRGEREERRKRQRAGRERNRTFLKEMRAQTVGSRKLLAFFVAVAAFCFSAMVQMTFSMMDLGSGLMGVVILVIGLVLAVTSMMMAVSSLVNGNRKNVAVMKAFGYTRTECARAVLSGFRPFGWAGFAVGTLYQYVLLLLMTKVFYADVGGVSYSFHLPAFFITLAAYIVFYELAVFLWSFAMQKIPIREIMAEN